VAEYQHLICSSGSIDDLIDLDLTTYVTFDQLALVASTGDHNDLLNKPDLTPYVMAGDLAVVALSGAYEDLINLPDLSQFILQDGSVPLAGDLDLAGHRLLRVAIDNSAPTAPIPGQLWWDEDETTLKAWTGADWLNLGQEMGQNVLPSNGLAAVSNGTMTNSLSKTYIADAVPISIGSIRDIMLSIGDQGTLQDIGVTFSMDHPDVAELEISLIAPGSYEPLVLVSSGSEAGESLEITLGIEDELPGEGSLTALIGHQQAGPWILRIMDKNVNGNEADGEMLSFKLETSYLASGQVMIAFDGMVEGDWSVAGEQAVAGSQTVAGDQTVLGTLTVAGTDVTATLDVNEDQLASLQAQLWCVQHCDEWRISDCKARLCDGVAQTCAEADTLADGSACDRGAGYCSNGECLAGDAGWWLDPDSQLMWQLVPQDNLSYIQSHNFCNRLHLGGYGDWRSPKIFELRTLIRGCETTVTGGLCNIIEGDCTSTSCMNDSCGGCGGGGPADGCFWPSEMTGSCYKYWSETNAGGDYRMIVDFDNAQIYRLHDESITTVAQLRCVRDAD
jgi:subtilisin-like proprotein convertase family protein